METGTACIARYTLEKQVSSYRDLFNSLTSHRIESRRIESNDVEVESEKKAFLNIIFQSYPESNPARQKELEYCILANLEHPNVKYIHDFTGVSNEYLSPSIISHPKYIHVPDGESNNGEWLTYKTAFTYSNCGENIKRFGIYWAIINCDILLAYAPIIKWPLIRGWLNSKYILAQSRYEYEPVSITVKPVSAIVQMDSNFSKLMHANTQDAWFYSTEHTLNVVDCNFKIGMLGCDNAIAHRFLSSGYKVINMPTTFPIWHYDLARGKNSTNFIEKHSQPCGNGKPKNTHPERTGHALIPNYDALMETGGGTSIDLIALINKLGGISNWEKYKLISEMMSSRILIFNP